VTGFAAVILLLTLGLAVGVVAGGRRLGRLAALPPRAPGAAPCLSLVVAARDEARGIEPAVRSMLAQDYPALELVVVDDRSTDGTGALLDRLAAADSRLTVVHVEQLPPGWLGKNHALQLGAGRAAGEWLLFTDADVHFAPGALGRAVRYAEERGLDHLAVAPALDMPGLMLRVFGLHFIQSFLAFARPWRARDPRSWFFVGVGAFNLVRRAAYEAVDGHRRLALRPDDDMKLGKVLKRAGFRQDALWGHGAVRVAWYHSVRELARGLEKNMFAGIEYSRLLSLAGGLVQLAGGVAPPVLLALTTGPARALLAAQVAVSLGLMAWTARRTGEHPALALAYPLAVLLFVFLLWRTMALNLVQGGIRWRGTFYPLDCLRDNRV
jgi:hypothetical protein